MFKKFLTSALLILALFSPINTISSFADGPYIGNANAAAVRDFQSDFIILQDYDVRTDGNPIYVGFAPRGTPTSDLSWTIYYFVYDGNAQMTSRTTAYDSWDNRVTATYN